MKLPTLLIRRIPKPQPVRKKCNSIPIIVQRRLKIGMIRGLLPGVPAPPRKTRSLPLVPDELRSRRVDLICGDGRERRQLGSPCNVLKLAIK